MLALVYADDFVLLSRLFVRAAIELFTRGCWELRSQIDLVLIDAVSEALMNHDLVNHKHHVAVLEEHEPASPLRAIQPSSVQKLVLVATPLLLRIDSVDVHSRQIMLKDLLLGLEDEPVVGQDEIERKTA